MKPLAQDVLKNQQNSETKINFYPERFEKTFIQWLENIEDWCISRQLWWGHRIPVFYHKETGEIYCEMDDPKDIENYTQDEDVLDTWFSSALWPFSTLGWPEKTEDFERYYPTDCLVTGYDIIFFWVARMAFQARHLTNDRPFKDVLIHGLIRDEKGRKMSKSLGNGVDPMDVKQKYGADALRFFLTTNSTPGADLRYTDTKMEASWNFINKIYNASKFVLMNLEGFRFEDIDLSNLNNIDSWIISKFNATLEDVNKNMEKYEFAMVGNQLYSFVWNDFCSWYIELAKSTINSADATVSKASKSTLLVILTNILKMLHPFMPFVTERIYAEMPRESESLCISKWPTTIDVDYTRNDEVDLLIEIISEVRSLRVDYYLKPSVEFDIALLDADANEISIDSKTNDMLYKLTKVSCKHLNGTDLIVRPLTRARLVVDASQIVDYKAEFAKLTKEKERLDNEIIRAEKMLANTNFVSKAPAEKIESEKKKLTDYKAQQLVVLEQLKQLQQKIK